MLGDKQENTLHQFCAVLGRLIKDHHRIDSLHDLRTEVATVLSAVERDFPSTLQVLFTIKLLISIFSQSN